MKVKMGLLCLLVLLVQTPVFSAEVTVVRTFPGNKGPGWKATIDVAGAVGPQHVVDFDVANFVVHDRTSGEILRRLTTQEFWKQVEPVGTLVPDRVANDARMLYDPLSERWFACAAGAPEADCFLAVSTSSDPTKPWRGTKLPLPRINPYMKMGVDRNGLYVCSCNGGPDPRKAMNCYVIPKKDVIAPDGPVLTHASNFPALQFSSMPATDLDPHKAADAPIILLTNEFDGICDKLYLYRITWSGLKASLSELQIVPLRNAYQTPNNSSGLMEAVQPEPGPNLHAGGGGRRLDSAFVHNGSVFGCNGAKRSRDSRPGVLWYEVRIGDGKLLQEGFVDSPDRDYIYPSIALDGHGNIGIGCTGTSKTEFPSVYVMDGPARIDEVFVPYRPKGGQYAWLERQGIGHAYDENRQDVMGMPLLDAAVRARYPKDGDVTKGPVKLIDLDPSAGWIADNTTWKSGLTKIYPAGEFKGDLGDSSWLLNEDLAFIYRAYSTYDKPLTITSPGNCWPTMPALEAGADVDIMVDAGKFSDWKTMAFYDGAKKLGEIAQGATARFTAKNLVPGYHVFSVLATDGDGNVRTADPKMVIVKAPAK